MCAWTFDLWVGRAASYYCISVFMVASMIHFYYIIEYL
jgi:hypothetical protein